MIVRAHSLSVLYWGWGSSVFVKRFLTSGSKCTGCSKGQIKGKSILKLVWTCISKWVLCTRTIWTNYLGIKLSKNTITSWLSLSHVKDTLIIINKNCKMKKGSNSWVNNWKVVMQGNISFDLVALCVCVNYKNLLKFSLVWIKKNMNSCETVHNSK